MARTRVFLADDHRMLLDAFTQMLSGEFDVVGTAEDGEQLLRGASTTEPDVIVLEIKMSKIDGIEAARLLQPRLPDTSFVFLTSSQSCELALQALDAAQGASFLVKAAAGSDLVQAIRAASNGQTYITPLMAGSIFDGALQARRDPITPRQRQVLRLLAQGKSMKQVGAALGISARTVAHHKYAMMTALGIDSNAELFRYAHQMT